MQLETRREVGASLGGFFLLFETQGEVRGVEAEYSRATGISLLLLKSWQQVQAEAEWKHLIMRANRKVMSKSTFATFACLLRALGSEVLELLS